MQLIEGQRVGKYELIRKLSQGGMAELFLACTSGPGGFRKFLVLKRLLPALRDDDAFLKMFLDEARLTAALWHPNIAQVYDLLEVDGELYLALEYIPGRNLRQILNQANLTGTRLPAGFGAFIARSVCQALHYAHHFTDPAGKPFPIVHRDVSPRNVMMTYDGSVKVIDYGIAKSRTRLEKTRAGDIKGTTGYVSPEQIRGVDLDGRSDLFALGIVLYEVVSGRKPFEARNDVELIQAVLFNDIVPLSEQCPTTPRALSDVCMRALARERDERFATGKQMARAIEEALGPELLDEDECAELMVRMFPKHVEANRALLTGHLADIHELREIADRIVDAAARTASTSSNLPDTLQVKGARPPQTGTATAAEQATGIVRPRDVDPPTTARAERVLVVDDAATIRGLMKHVLDGMGLEIETCESPKKALELLSDHVPDVMLLDVMMPGMTGFELCKLVRQDPRTLHVPIIFVSAACSLEERVEGLAAGGDDFMRKPFEAAELRARVRAQLQRAARQRR